MESHSLLCLRGLLSHTSPTVEPSLMFPVTGVSCGDRRLQQMIAFSCLFYSEPLKFYIKDGPQKAASIDSHALCIFANQQNIKSWVSFICIFQGMFWKTCTHIHTSITYPTTYIHSCTHIHTHKQAYIPILHSHMHIHTYSKNTHIYIYTAGAYVHTVQI